MRLVRAGHAYASGTATNLRARRPLRAGRYTPRVAGRRLPATLD